MLSLDIATVEARHASNREVTLLRARGWVPSLATLCAAFVSKTVGSASKPDCPDLKAPPKKEESHKRRGQPGPAKRRGGGGAWRAFLSQKCKSSVSNFGVRFTSRSLSELAEEYRRLTPSDRAVFEEAGQAGALAHGAGYASFGKRIRRAGGQMANAPQPGSVSESGAIIGSNTEIDRALAFHSLGGLDFPQQFERVKDIVNLEFKTKAVEFTEDEETSLSQFMSATEDSHLVQGLQQGQHIEMSPCFSQVGSHSGNVLSLNWFPPVCKAVKARPKFLKFSYFSYIWMIA